MDRQTIKDRYGSIIGFIDVESNGDKTVRSPNGSVLGYYRKAMNVTVNTYGSIIAQGDCCGMLFR